MASAAPSATMSPLRGHLEKYGVPAAVIEYVTTGQGGIGLETISDFASLFAESDYEAKCGTHIIEKVETHKEDVRALARLRTAWWMARVEMRRTAERAVSAPAEDDWDTPLSNDVEETRAATFQTAYPDIVFEAEDTLIPTIIGRLYREFKNRAVTQIPLERMRSEAEFKVSSGEKRRRVSDEVSITFHNSAHRLPDICFESTVQILWAVHLLCNGWALVGAELVPSKVEVEGDGTQKKVRQCHLNEANAYHSFVTLKVQDHPGSEGEVIAWVLERHRITIAKAISLFKAGWPWGEAIRVARENHCAVQWNLASIGVARSQQAVDQHKDAASENDEYEQNNALGRRRRRGRRGGQNPATDANKVALKPRQPAPVPPPPGGKGGGKGKQGAHNSQQARSSGSKGGKSGRGNQYCPDFNSWRGCTARGRDCPHGLPHLCNICGTWAHGAANCPRRK